MMDWTSIITALIAALVPTGGLLAIVTMTEKKSALMLENSKKLADSYKELAEEYKAREAENREVMNLKEDLLQAQAKQAREELVAQVKMNSSLRHSLDDAHTDLAVCKILYCKETACINRRPPLGQDAEEIVRKTKENSRRAYGCGDDKQQPNGNHQ